MPDNPRHRGGSVIQWGGDRGGDRGGGFGGVSVWLLLVGGLLDGGGQLVRVLDDEAAVRSGTVAHGDEAARGAHVGILAADDAVVSGTLAPDDSTSKSNFAAITFKFGGAKGCIATG